MSIFRAYDIRGVYPRDLDSELGGKIGKAFGTFIHKRVNEHLKINIDDIEVACKIAESIGDKLNKAMTPKIAVGCDARIGSPELKKSLIKGLVSSGIHVIDIGTVPTPLVYFAVVQHKLDGGVMVTGSHNSGEYNGFKFCGGGSLPIGYEGGIKELEGMVKRGVFFERRGRVEKKDFKKDYIDFVLKKTKLRKKLKIVIDAGNGVAGLVAPKVFEKLGCEVIKMFCEPNGNFPNHLPNPLKRETLKDLQEAVVRNGADLGIAYDGDGDRVGFVDSGGNVVNNDHVFSIFARDVLSKKPGSKIVFDAFSSNLIEHVIKENGGRLMKCRVGYTFIRDKMNKEGAVLAGEASSHYYFRESFGYDDAIFASLRFAQIVSASDINELIRDFPEFHTSDDTRIHCPDSKKFAVVEGVKKKLKKSGHKIEDIDGVKVFLEDGWFLIRPSNTEPVLVLKWESKSKDGFRKMGDIARREIERALRVIS